MKYVIALSILLTACGQSNGDNATRALAASKIPTDIYSDSFHFSTYETSLNGTDCTYAATFDGDNVSGVVTLVHGQPNKDVCPNEIYNYANSNDGLTVCDDTHCEAQQ